MGLSEASHRGDRFGVRDARGRLVLDAAAAAQLNAIRAELRRLDRFAASPPLVYSSDAAGRRWQLDRPLSVYAKLTGTSGSAYTWAEATRDASGASSLVSGGRTGTAYEANLATGLTGTYATLDWTPASGDWRFQAIRAGGAGSTPTPGFAICCGSAIPSPLTLTWTFAGSSTAPPGYSNHYQNTTLTFSATRPSYAGGGPSPGSPAGAFYSPLLPLTETFTGEQMYYMVICTGSGLIGLSLGFYDPSSGTPLGDSACQVFASYTCSPFLASGVTAGGGCQSDGFGTNAGDDMVLS